MSQITKTALADSLKNLLSKKPLKKITVVDIVNDCGVNRQTFYYHFQDIYALLDWVFTRETEKAIAGEITYENWQQYFTKIYEYTIWNKSFANNVYCSVGREYLERYLFEVVYHYVHETVGQFDIQSNLSLDDQCFVARFFSYAFVGTVLDWIKNGMKENHIDIIKMITKLVEGDIEKFIQYRRSV